jgi:hypothetical protein
VVRRAASATDAGGGSVTNAGTARCGSGTAAARQAGDPGRRVEGTNAFSETRASGSTDA